MTIYYPDVLPKGLIGSRTYQVVSPLQRSQLTSGRARQRRKYISTPERDKISFLFSDSEGQAFEAWFREVLKDGALWFECPLRTPLGLNNHSCRFTDIYQGPNPVGPDLWSYSGEVELLERAVLEDGWGEFPELVAGSAIIDIALNEKWPLNPWQTHAGAMDNAINKDWPQP